MKNILHKLLACFVTLVFVQTSFAQCSNTNTQYGSSNAPSTVGVLTTLSTCMYGGEYRLVNNLVAGSQYSFETCGDTDFDTQITIYDATTGALVAYNDDFCGLQSKAQFTSNGNSVRVLINRYFCSSQSSCMTLRATRVTSSAPPAVNPCNSISSLSCANNSSSYSLSGSGSWNGLGGPWSTPGAEQVFSFTPVLSGSHDIAITNNNYYVDLYIKAGSCSSSGWTYIDDISSFGTGTNTVTLTAGVTYYLLIDDENTTTSSGTISITCATPVNDPCNSITPIASCGSSASFSLSGSGAWNGLGGPWSTPGEEAVYSFTPAISGAYPIVVTNSGYYVDLYVKAGSCGSTGWTYVSDIFSNETNTVNLTAGVTYLFLIDDENTSASSGSITIDCPCIAPPGGIDGSYTYNGNFVISGTTVGACNDCSLRPSNDRVYEVEIPECGDYTFSMCGGASWDTYLYLRTAACGGASIALNDDACGLQSEISTFLTSGTYYIHVEGWSANSQGSFNMSVSGTIFTPTFTTKVSNVRCFGGATGSIKVNGASAGSTYVIDGNSQSSNVFGGLSAGTYEVSTVDANGCTSDVVTVTVNEPALLTSSSTSGSIACFGGTTVVTVSAAGGTLPYTGVGNFTVTAGTYTYVVTDRYNCSTSTTITVEEPTLLTVDLEGCAIVYEGVGIEYACATINGSAAGGTPGYSYDWTTSESTASVIVCPDSTATYTFETTDANGCSASADWTVEVIDISCTKKGGSSSHSSHSNSKSKSKSKSSHSSSSASSVSSGISYESKLSRYSCSSSSSGSGSGSGSKSGSSGSSSSCKSKYSSLGSAFSSVSGSACSSKNSPNNNKDEVKMCLNGVTYCVKVKHIQKRLNCGYTLGACDEQQTEACNNVYPADTTISCVCSGKLVSLTVRYIGASNQDINVNAKKCNVPLLSLSSVTTGDVFTVDASAGGISYLRKETYFELAGTNFGKIEVPTNCCENPVGKVFFPFEVIGWTDTDGNACTDASAREGGKDITDRAVAGRSASESNTSILGTTPAALLSTSPNPLERSTNFNFTIPETETAKLEVINLKGESSVIFAGTVQGGINNNIAFDASNLASGIYFVQLSTPTLNVKNKIIVIK